MEKKSENFFLFLILFTFFAALNYGMFFVISAFLEIWFFCVFVLRGTSLF